jgi:hypothetical protein
MGAHPPLPDHAYGFGIARVVFAQFHLYRKDNASSPRGSPHHPDRERPDGGHRAVARGARWGLETDRDVCSFGRDLK